MQRVTEERGRAWRAVAHLGESRSGRWRLLNILLRYLPRSYAFFRDPAHSSSARAGLVAEGHAMTDYRPASGPEGGCAATLARPEPHAPASSKARLLDCLAAALPSWTLVHAASLQLRRGGLVLLGVLAAIMSLDDE